MADEVLPLSAPAIGGNAWKYVKECLDTGWVSSVGRFVSDFERALEKTTGSPHAVACVNGTAGLHTALNLCGIGRGDAVLVPAVTFIATANAVAYTGAACVFVDCEPARFNMDFPRLEEWAKKNLRRTKGGALLRGEGVKVKALMATHILGYPLDLDAAAAFCRKWGLILLEDAAESVGSTWGGRHCGTFGRFGVMSFNGNKIITTGGGGAILSGGAKLAARAKHLTTQAKSDAFEYVHDEVGYNYRLTNVLAALGVSQLELLPSYLEKRNRISAWYRAALPGLRVEPDHPKASWNRWLLGVCAKDAKAKARALKALNDAGCQSRPLWLPVPMQKPFRGHPSMPVPGAKRAYATAINVPSTTSLDEAGVRRAAKVLASQDLTRALF